MTRLTYAFASIVLAAAGVVYAQAGWGDLAFEYYLRGVAESYQQNYAAGMMDQITSVMAEDVVIRGVDGTVYEGRSAYAALLQGWSDMGARLDATGPNRFGFIGDDAAYATWTWDFVGPDGNTLLSGESFYVYRATPQGWELVQQFSAPFPPSEQ